MINKFRYKKPPQVPSKSGGGKVRSDDIEDVLIEDVEKLKIGENDIVLSSGFNDKSKLLIKELFSQLQFSPETALPPDALRRALAESFFDQQRFQLGFMDDAAECFENMLLRIHQHVAHGEAEDACAAPHCVPHQKFAMTLVEQVSCGNCGASSEPLSFTQMVHYVSTSSLVYQAKANAGRQNYTEPFGKLLQKAGNMGDMRQCPSSCGSVVEISKTLMNHPEIVSVGLVWNSERPTLEHIMEVFSSVGTTLRLGDVFKTVVGYRFTEISVHNLVGVVTYYGKHYSTFFFHTKLRVWIYFDDATVREVGPRWEQVVEKCRKGRYQPLLLLYSSPDGTPVSTDTAPKQVTSIYTERTNVKPKITSQPLLRRSVTPSPEKPIIGNTRRAITPNPDSSLHNQKPSSLPRSHNEYQNLSVIQKSIYAFNEMQEVDQVDGCVTKREPEYVTRKSLDIGKAQVHRTLSNGSSSGVEGLCIPDHLNLPRRRDSGNWSGDRNSASSASSTTMENPYFYLVGKIPHNKGSVPSSPTRVKSDSSSGGSGHYDAGYDSYSLSSNDSSSMSTLQHLMKAGHLAKIPEDYTNPNQNQCSLPCDVLCIEADELLVKSRQLEDEHDLVLALALCNAAATKARAAMNAPYNNPQTLTLARMKHNTCIMRARSLHRRMTQTQSQTKDKPLEIRHTREGSSGSRHSRQNSKDKGQHSRQSSRELLIQQEKEKARPIKSIEIYATLPKKKDALKTKINDINIEDAEYMFKDKPAERESRSIFSRSKSKDNKVKEKRSRSEDRNKMCRVDFSIAPEIITGKDTLKKAKDNKEKEEKKEKDGKNKKQHKIRRKLLMGGLIRRKNRSMPDLTDATAEENNKSKLLPTATLDDSKLGTDETNKALSGYLSEGHLEFVGSNTSSNLERSKLMRKSFHCSAGKILTATKVPPPPPLRTTSQLSKSKLNVSGEVGENGREAQPFDLFEEVNHYHNLAPYNQCYKESESSMSLPYYHHQNSSFDDDSFANSSSHTVVTQADVHQEHLKTSPAIGVDEVDCLPSHSISPLELPPYPSPIGSAIHSRQASEDFPPPPPPSELTVFEDNLPKSPNEISFPFPEPNSLLAKLQVKRQQILSQENENKSPSLPVKSNEDIWLKELQTKQAALKIKKNEILSEQQNGVDEVNTQRYLPGETKLQSVKDLASKFEFSDVSNVGFKPLKLQEAPAATNNKTYVAKNKDCEISTIAPKQIAEELREVDMITSAVNQAFRGHVDHNEANKKPKAIKKKSVSFCDQVILVATAEEREDDTYIPNPILERVLRSAINKPEAAAIRQEIISLREQTHTTPPQNKQGFVESSNIITSALPVPSNNQEQPVYIRTNSVENLLNRPNVQEIRKAPEYSVQNNNNYNGQASIISQNSIVSMPQTHFPAPQPSSCERQYPVYNTNNGYLGPPNNPAMMGHHNIEYKYTQPIENNGYCNRQPESMYSLQSLPQTTNHSPYNNNNNVEHQQHFKPTMYTEQQYHTTPYGQVRDFNTVSHQQHPYLNEGVLQQHPTGELHEKPVNGINQRQRPEQIVRQSAYKSVPVTAAVHPAYYGNNRMPLPNGYEQTYSSLPKPSQNYPQVRQYTPSPTIPSYPTYNQTTPSPTPSMGNQNNGYHTVMYRGPVNTQAIYQRVSPHPYQPQERSDVYQRVPLPHGDESLGTHGGKYSPYQQVPYPKQILKKSVSGERGVKGCEPPASIPKAIVTPIIVNNANNSVPTDKTKCNLCRKKNVASLNLYCTDCEFYMSKFKPRC